MPQSLVQVYLHIVFSTKGRLPVLHDRDVRDHLYGYLAGTLEHLRSPSLIINGVEDHLHILCRLSKILPVSILLRDIKRSSSAWLTKTFAGFDDFHWQNGYGAFSVSPHEVGAVTSYIARQEEHHKSESFQDEFRRLCREYGVEFDERYMWD